MLYNFLQKSKVKVLTKRSDFLLFLCLLDIILRVQYFYLKTFDMDKYIPEEVLHEITKLTEEWKYSDAIEMVNKILTRDPKNEQALLMIADIQYRQWNMDWADKAVTFLNSTKEDDPIWLYVKWLLEMEKNNWKEARSYLKKAMQITNWENHEIVRCYWLSEYRYGNREKWRDFLRKAFKQDSLDAEVIYNIIQLSILDEDYEESKEMISFYHDNHAWLKIVDKSIGRYDKKIALFEKYLWWKSHFKLDK